MVFLNPAVLFGLLAASIPVVIHLLNLRKLKKVEFSTLAFLKELQKTKIRRIKLKQWILLALRILIILLLVAAFARPTIKSISVGGTASAAKTSAVIVLDDTYSMAVVAEQGSYFNKAKQTVKNLLGEFQEGDEVSVVLVSGQNSLNATTNFSSVISFVDNSEISFVSGTIHKSLIKAAQILSSSDNFNKEIYILSDFQKTELKSVSSVQSDLSGLLPKDIRLYTFDYRSMDPANLTLTDLKVNNQIFEKGKIISFSASVKNTSEKSFNNAVVSLFINGSRSAQQSFSARPGETKLLNFETTLKENGLLEIIAELEDDDIEFDNKRYLSLYVPEKIKTALFYDKISDTKFVELALSGASNSAPISIAKYPLSRAASVNLNNFDAVIIIGSETINNYDRLRQYSENGGSLLIMPGSGSTLNRFQKLCEEIGISQPSGFRGEMNNNSNPAVFEETDFMHPIFKNLYENESGSLSKREIDSPEIYYYLKTSPSGGSKKIISLIDGSAFLSEFDKNNGRILLFNSAPVLSWSNFPLKGIFPPLINKSVFYLSSKIKNVTTYKAGDEILVKINNLILPQLTVKKPERGEEIINIDSLGIINYLKYSKTEKPGYYNFYSGGRLYDYASVNFNPIGSEISYLSEEDIKDYLEKINFKGRLLDISPDDNFSAAIYQSRFGSELWRYFLIAAMLLAVIEMLISRSAKKDLVS